MEPEDPKDKVNEHQKEALKKKIHHTDENVRAAVEYRN